MSLFIQGETSCRLTLYNVETLFTEKRQVNSKCTLISGDLMSNVGGVTVTTLSPDLHNENRGIPTS